MSEKDILNTMKNLDVKEFKKKVKIIESLDTNILNNGGTRISDDKFQKLIDDYQENVVVTAKYLSNNSSISQEVAEQLLSNINTRRKILDMLSIIKENEEGEE